MSRVDVLGFVKEQGHLRIGVCVVLGFKFGYDRINVVSEFGKKGV